MNPEDYIQLGNKSQFIQNYLKNDKRLIRLFAVACCYQIWDLIKDERSQKAVKIAELYADGLATEEQRQKASYYYLDDSISTSISAFAYAAHAAAATVFAHDPFFSYYTSAYHCASSFAAYSINDDEPISSSAWKDKRNKMFKQQSIILLNMKGNWNNSYNTKDVTDLATTIYNNKSFELMPILADALQEAGCQDENILEYCQGNHFFFRGCWILDKATGKR